MYEERTVSGNGSNGRALIEAPVRPTSAPPTANRQPQASLSTTEKIRQARLKGYEGDPCGNCGAFTLVRNGVCLKCDSCGETTGCS